MSIFRLSNGIFSLRLNAQEIAVYAYLCSLPPSTNTLLGDAVIAVRQRTIAAHCGIKSPVTVSRTIDRLRQKGLVEHLERSKKADGQRGTYSYAVKLQQIDKGYFMVERRVFGMLTPRQMLVYLFLCKSFSTVLHDCWNSYNDIAAQIGMKRKSVVQIIGELVAAGLIVRMQRKARENRRVVVDNHYLIVCFTAGHIRRKMPRQYLASAFVLTNYFHDNRKVCAVQSLFFMPVRGSP